MVKAIRALQPKGELSDKSLNILDTKTEYRIWDEFVLFNRRSVHLLRRQLVTELFEDDK